MSTLAAARVSPGLQPWPCRRLPPPAAAPCCTADPLRNTLASRLITFTSPQDGTPAKAVSTRCVCSMRHPSPPLRSDTLPRSLLIKHPAGAAARPTCPPTPPHRNAAARCCSSRDPMARWGTAPASWPQRASSSFASRCPSTSGAWDATTSSPRWGAHQPAASKPVARVCPPPPPPHSG